MAIKVTEPLILEHYDCIDDALDDYVDAKEKGLTCDTFERWFEIQFSNSELQDHILDGPDVPPVDFGDGGEGPLMTSRLKKPPKSPSGGNAAPLPESPGEDPPRLVTA